MRRDLRQPNGRLHSFYLAEKRPNTIELVLAPMLQKAGGFRSDLPLAGDQGAPRIHLAPHLVDNRGKVVLLAFGRNALAFVQDEFFLRSLSTLSGRLLYLFGYTD